MYKLFNRLSRIMAYLGGLVLVALIVLTCLSIAGRLLNGLLHSAFFENSAPDFAKWALARGIGPVNGDFELIEAGIAFAIFAFLPLCQISGGHASVDIFTKAMPPFINRLLQFAIDTVFALVLVLITVQMYGGMLSKMRSGQTTFLLEFPLWWAYAFSMIGAIATSLIAVYVAVVRAAELFRSKQILPTPQSA